MEFGKLSPNEIKDVQFSLPDDGPLTASILSKAKKKQGNQPQFYVGCAKWGRREWLGQIYPPKTKANAFLSAYTHNFNAIELNAVFYKLPKEEQLETWKLAAEQSPIKNFKFCPKFSRTISHLKKLKNAESQTDLFVARMHQLSPHLGPAFLQLGESFAPKNLDLLESYLSNLPMDFKVFVELRHPDWFAIPTVSKELFQMLAHHKRGAVITDASGRRDCLHMNCTTPQTFIRFVGNGGTFLNSDKRRIDDWVKRLKKWLDAGLQEVYFFLHQHDEKDTPIIAKYTIEQFNKHLGTNLAEINLLN